MNVVCAAEQYESALSASHQENPAIEERKRVLVETITAIDTRMKEVRVCI